MHGRTFFIAVVAAAWLIPALAFGQSIRFNGTVDQAYDRITIPVDGGSSANIGATDFTIELWLRPDATRNNGSGTAWWQGNIFLDRDMLGGVERSFGASLLSGRVAFTTHPAGGGQTVFTATSDIRDDNWHWIVITYDRSSGVVQVYVDGQREVNAAGSAGDLSFLSSSNTKDRLIELGGEKHFQGTPSFVGFMSEVRFSGIVRYSGPTITVPSSALGVDGDTLTYWSFTEGSGSTLNDSAAGGSHGTIVFGGSPEVPSWSAETPYSGGGSSGSVQLEQASIDVPESANTMSPAVVRSGGSVGAASVNLSTSPGTATAGADYQTTVTQVNWADGEQGSKDVAITLFPDTQPESDETFSVELSDVTGAVLGSIQTATITIIDDDAAGDPGTVQFSQADISVGESNSAVTITVDRQGGSAGAASADVATSPGTATADADYETTVTQVNWADGEDGSRNVPITLFPDTQPEPDETFSVELSNVTGAAPGARQVATVTIIDDDTPGAPGTIQFSQADFSVGEGSAAATISVNRQGGSTGPISADYATADGTATAGSDYQSATGTVSYGDGETGEKNFSVIISEDTLDEPAETVLVSISGANVGSPSMATLTIQDNDVPPPVVDPPPPRKKSSGGAFDWLLLAALALASCFRAGRRFAAA